MKKVFKLFREFILIIMMGCIALIIVQLLPENRIKYHIEQSAEQLVTEGDYYYLGSEQQAFLIDNWTEAALLMFNYTAEKQRPVYSAFIATSYMPEKITGVNRLQSMIDDAGWKQREELVERRGTNWIGYNIFLRLGLCFFSLNKLRIGLYVISYFLLSLTVLTIYKYLNLYKALSFALTMILFNFYTLSISWSLGIFCIYIACLAIIYFLHRQNDIDYFNYMFVVGILTAFFDWLSIPLITWGLPIILIITVENKRNEQARFKEYINILLKTGIGWCLGYAGTIISKIVIAILIQGREAYDFFIKRLQADTRNDGMTSYFENVYKLICSIIPFNLFNEGSSIPKILLVLIGVICIYIIFIWRNKRILNSIYLIIALSPLVYYLYVRGHIGHIAIEFRTMIISCFALLLMVEPIVNTLLKQNKLVGGKNEF